VTDVGYFGVAVWHPKFEVNVGSLWRTAHLFGASFLATVGARYRTRQAGDTMNSTQHIPLHHYDTVDQLVETLPHSCPLVGVELDPRAVPLNRFHHPMRALYLLGAEDHGLPPKVTDRCHYLVQIPSVVPRSMNVANAGAITLADRHMNPQRRLTRRAMEVMAS
jgi:tRNA G18 (ribose-2'-O)-methylase SpoU